MIGVTAWLHRARWSEMDEAAVLVEESFLDKVLQTDTPVIVIPPYARLAERVVERIDGLMLTGGPDLNPAYYGQPRNPQTRSGDPRRDEAEIALTRAALARGIPVLGICRGCQVLNVACGGTLVQHIPDAYRGVRHAADDPAALEGGAFTTHEVIAAPGSAVEATLGPRFAVQSAHHQAVAIMSEEIAAVAWSEDGVIEAIAHVSRPFVLGVQWHPEADAGMALFEALVVAAGLVARHR
ncbi:MAG: gamma-glutamyl-gamma-aminobutyrate hydrolase family protein [Solirubrobacteraceae bacterium]